jgi:hypothetical protein
VYTTNSTFDIGCLRNKIVVVGWADPGDVHQSVVGKVPGYLLQANYIEALLDDRYFGSVRCWTNYLTGLMIFAAFQMILVFYEHKPLRLLGTLAFLFIGVLGCIYLIMMHLHIYLNPMGIGLLAIGIKLTDLLFSSVKETRTGEMQISPLTRLAGTRRRTIILILIAIAVTSWVFVCHSTQKPSRVAGHEGAAASNRDLQSGAAFVLARLGNAAQAERIPEELAK